MDTSRTPVMLWCGLLFLALLSGCSSGGGDTPVIPDPPDTAAEFTARGWTSFGSSHFDDALSDFASALAQDSGYGEALAGQGWALLSTAVSTVEANAARSSFSQALLAGENENYVLAGQAAAFLASGDTNLLSALSAAGSVLSSDPSFVFSHRISFDSRDLLLIRAMALAVQGYFQLALDEADLIADSGIDQDDPATWVSGGSTYNSFVAAVMARLQQLSEQYSG